MSAQNLWDLALRKGIVMTGHFKLSSGRHSNVYFNKDALYCDPMLYAMVIRGMEYLSSVVGKQNFEVVTAPAVAGIALAAPVALYFGKVFAYTEKAPFEMTFRKPYQQAIAGKRVLILEDIVTTGASVDRVMRAVKAAGGDVIDVCCIWNRGGAEWGDCPILSLLKEPPANDWTATDCPLCAAGVELTQPK